MTHYHAGHNVSGYLPMSDDTGYPYQTFSDAVSALEDELTRDWDDACDLFNPFDEDNETVARIESEYNDARQAMREAEAPAFLTYTPTNFDSEHDIPTAWWVTPCDDDECSADDE